MPSSQGSILSNIRPPSSDSNNIGKSLLGALSWKQNYDLNNSEERRRQEAHELNKSVYQAKTAAARSQASAAGEKAQREQGLENMQFINRLGKKLLQTDQSQWGAILAPNMPALEQIGYTPQILSNMTPEQVQGVVAQTDAALYDFDRDMKRKEFEASRIDADRDYKADRIDADRGYNLDRDKFGADRVDANRDFGLQEKELGLKQKQFAVDKADAEYARTNQFAKASKMTVHQQKRLSQFTDEAVEASNNASSYARLADEVEGEDFSGGLFGGSWRTALKEATGADDAVVNLRMRYKAIVNNQVIQNLPAGAASDNDIKMAKSGFPPSNAPASRIASFLRGLSKMERHTAEYAEFKAEYMSERGNERGMLNAWKTNQKEQEKATDDEYTSLLNKYGIGG